MSRARRVWSSSCTRLLVGAVSRQRSSCPVKSGRVVFASCKTYRRLRCQFVVIHSQCHSGYSHVSYWRSRASTSVVRFRAVRQESRLSKKKSRSRRQRNMKPEAVRRSASHPSTRHRFASFSVCRLPAGTPGSRWTAFGFRGARPGWQRRY